MRKHPTTLAAENPNQRWQTPPELFATLHGIFDFTIDACASSHNHLLPRYWTIEDDASQQDWSKERVFCNPPFTGAGKFIAQAPTARLAVVLLPVNTLTTNYIHDALPQCVAIPRGRIQYLPPPELPEPAPTKAGSGLMIYNATAKQIAALKQAGFWMLGSV